MNETNVSYVSTDWSIQLISIRSDLPIFIDKTIPIFLSIDNCGELRCICKKCFVPLKLTLVSPILRQIAVIQEL